MSSLHVMCAKCQAATEIVELSSRMSYVYIGIPESGTKQSIREVFGIYDQWPMINLIAVILFN